MKIQMTVTAEGFQNDLNLDAIETILEVSNKDLENYLWRWFRSEGLDIRHIKVEVQKVTEEGAH